MRRNALLLIIALLVLVLSSGCALSQLIAEEQAVMPTPTRTPKPTFTPTPAETPTPELAPTNTPTPTPAATDTPVATPTPEVSPTPEASPTPETSRLVVNNPTLNVRSGPGTTYPAIGTARNGDRYDITGTNPSNTWWQIDFSGRAGWVSGQYVSLEGNTDAVEVVANIQPPPQPTRAPAPQPQPTQPPSPPAQPQPTAPPPQPSTPWVYMQGSAIPAPQCGVPNFEGQVQYPDGSPQNGVCVLMDYYGPRQIKYSGGGGKGDGNWGFSPCGGGDCKGPFKIYIVECPSGVPDAGLSLDPGSAAPPAQSTIFTAEITDKCVTGQWTNIIFRGPQ